jgi:photosystem II stability/assembly factor-like uncharacterized protein
MPVGTTACLSTNGPSVYHCTSAPTRLLVATTNGISVLERPSAGVDWQLSGSLLAGKHISALMIEPRHGGLFAGVHHGGLFYSPDAGGSWERRANGLTIEHVYSLGSVERPDGVVIYAGTEPVSLFRSRDYGKTWDELPAIGKVPGHEKWTFPPPPHLAHTKSFTFDPRNPDVFYATIEQGALLKTRDGGVTWRELGSFYRPDDAWYKDIHRLVFRPSNPDELFMASGMGLYHSADAGETWEQRTGLDFEIGYPDQLILSPLDDRIMLMSGARHDPSTWRQSHEANGTVLRTRDGGRSWEAANRGLPKDARANIEALNAAVYPGGYALFAGNTDGEVFCSENGGDSWSQIAGGLTPISKGGHYRNLLVATG